MAGGLFAHFGPELSFDCNRLHFLSQFKNYVLFRGDRLFPPHYSCAASRLLFNCEWMNKLVILLFACAFRIALANNSATLSTLIFGLGCRKGIVSQTTNSSSTLFSILA